MKRRPKKLPSDETSYRVSELLIELSNVARDGILGADAVVTAGPDSVSIKSPDTLTILILIGHWHRLFGTPTHSEITELIGKIPGRLQADARRLSSEIWGVDVDDA